MVATTTADIPGELLAIRLEHLLQEGWDARLFCKGARWLEEPALHAGPVRAHVTFAPGARAGSSPFSKPLRRLAPDLVHFLSGWAAWKELSNDRLPASAVAVSLREDGQDLAVPDPAFLCGRADVLLFAHKAAFERAAALGWPCGRAAILPTPVATVPREHPVMSASGPLQILSAGPIIWEQGFEHSIHAVRLLLDAGVECNYRIVGEGDHLPAVAFARHQLELADRIALLEPGDGAVLARELQRADVFVDPSVTDTTPVAPLQAAVASGLPGVVTAGCDRVVGGAGIEVPRRDPHALARALEQLAKSPEAARRMGREGQRHVGERVRHHLVSLEALYRGILRRKADGAVV